MYVCDFYVVFISEYYLSSGHKFILAKCTMYNTNNRFDAQQFCVISWTVHQHEEQSEYGQRIQTYK